MGSRARKPLLSFPSPYDTAVPPQMRSRVIDEGTPKYHTAVPPTPHYHTPVPPPQYTHVSEYPLTHVPPQYTHVSEYPVPPQYTPVPEYPLTPLPQYTHVPEYPVPPQYPQYTSTVYPEYPQYTHVPEYPVPPQYPQYAPVPPQYTHVPEYPVPPQYPQYTPVPPQYPQYTPVPPQHPQYTPQQYSSSAVPQYYQFPSYSQNLPQQHTSNNPLTQEDLHPAKKRILLPVPQHPLTPIPPQHPLTSKIPLNHPSLTTHPSTTTQDLHPANKRILRPPLSTFSTFCLLRREIAAKKRKSTKKSHLKEKRSKKRRRKSDIPNTPKPGLTLAISACDPFVQGHVINDLINNQEVYEVVALVLTPTSSSSKMVDISNLPFPVYDGVDGVELTSKTLCQKLHSKSERILLIANFNTVCKLADAKFGNLVTVLASMDIDKVRVLTNIPYEIKNRADVVENLEKLTKAGYKYQDVYVHVGLHGKVQLDSIINWVFS